MNESVEIKGYAEAVAALRGIPIEADKKIVASALRIALKPVLKSAKQNVPVGSTGFLKNSLRIVNYRGSRSKSEKAMSVRHIFAKRMNGEDSGNQYYAAMVHDGTVDERKPKEAKALRMVGKDGQVYFAKKAKGLVGRPYLKGAIEANESKVVDDFGKSFTTAVEKYVKKTTRL